MANEAETYLRRLIEDRLRLIAETQSDLTSFVPSTAMQEVQAAADALVAVGLLDAHRSSELCSSFRATLVDSGVIREVRASMQAESSVAAAVDEESAARWRAIAEQREPPVEPVRVVPVVLELGRLNDDATLIVISLELWSASFRIRYATGLAPRGDDEAPRPLDMMLWDAADDVGTRYRGGGGGASGGHDWIVGDTEMRPAIPPEATSLTITAHTFDDRTIGHLDVPL